MPAARHAWEAGERRPRAAAGPSPRLQPQERGRGGAGAGRGEGRWPGQQDAVSGAPYRRGRSSVQQTRSSPTFRTVLAAPSSELWMRPYRRRDPCSGPGVSGQGGGGGTDSLALSPPSAVSSVVYQKEVHRFIENIFLLKNT